MYKTVVMFTDLQDNNYKYEVGDEYPRLGLKPSLARIKELSTPANRRGVALIEEVDIPFSDSAVTEEDVQPKKKAGRKKKED